MSSTFSFLRRWSQLKLQNPPQPATLPAPADALPSLPSLDALDFNADFSPFMHAGVDGETRRNALRKLFMTDHYRVMDGLDVYIEDYSRPALLSPELLQTLDHAQALLMKPDEADPGVLPENPEQV